MAVTQTKGIPWKPDLCVLKQKLDVHESDVPLFERAYAVAAEYFSPCVHFQKVRLEAVGDHFVLLSGIWIEEERLVRALNGATGLLAFAVSGVEANKDMEWLLSLSETAALDAAHAWISDLAGQTGECFRMAFFPQTKEWANLLSLPNDRVDGLCGVAYVAPCGGCSRGEQKCAGGCSQTCNKDKCARVLL